MTSPELDEIKRRAADGMRGYLDHEGAERTINAKKIAEALVDARPLFYTRNGDPDYLGSSHAYRAFVSSALDEAGVPKADRSSLQAAIRYHVSPMLRDRYGEEVARLGLEPGSTRERARRRSERDARIISLFSGGGEITDVDDALLAANLSRLAVSRVSGVPGAGKVDKGLVRDAFEKLETAVGEARRRIG
ncbi:hypothetical protein GMYAFLOJ_CDS0028 [Microbacterium phage phiMiGM15]